MSCIIAFCSAALRAPHLYVHVRFTFLFISDGFSSFSQRTSLIFVFVVVRLLVDFDAECDSNRTNVTLKHSATISVHVTQLQFG